MRHIVVAVVVAALLTAGCSSGSHTTALHASGFKNVSTSAAQNASGVTAVPNATPSPTGSCEIFERGNDARIIFTGSSETVCAANATGLSSGGEFWSQQPQAPSEQLSEVCAMTQGEQVANVLDSGGQYDGRSVCSSFLQAGWSEDTSAEQNAALASEAASKSAAQASASVAQQQALARDQQTELAAISNLQGVTLTKDLTTIGDDVAKTGTDLAQTRADAAKGPGDDCYNVGQVVGYDAQQNVEYDAQQDVEYDIAQNLSPDIATIRAAERDLQGDTQTLIADGLSIPANARTVASSANSVVSQAIAAANGYIDQTNADVTAAYAVANAMATGACSGDGPGAPPAPLPHIG